MNKNTNYVIFLKTIMGFLIIYILLFCITFQVFAMLFHYTKKLLQEKHNFNVIYLFFSGYITRFILFYLIPIFYSINNIKIINIDLELIPNNIKDLLIFEFMILLYIFFLAGITLIITFYHKCLKDKIILICIGIYISPYIFYVIGTITKLYTIFNYLNMVVNLIAFGLGIFFNYKYYNQVSDKLGFIELTNKS